MQPGDVAESHADVSDLSRDTGFHPSTSVEKGIAAFVEWYREYYRI
jgi:UDP-glucuronate 4-epimerase